MLDNTLQYIGVLHGRSGQNSPEHGMSLVANLKRNLILFDSVYVLNLNDLYDLLAKHKNGDSEILINDLEMMEDQGFVINYTDEEVGFDIDNMLAAKPSKGVGFHDQLAHAHGYMADLHGVIAKLYCEIEKLSDESQEQMHSLMAQILRLNAKLPVGLETIDSLWSRYAAEAITHATDQNVVALDPPPKSMIAGVDRIATLADVYTITLAHLPVFSSSIPLGEVLSFKADSNTQKNLAQLRIYLKELVKTTNDYKEIYEKCAP